MIIHCVFNYRRNIMKESVLTSVENEFNNRVNFINQPHVAGLAPFFSMRKLRLIYNQLVDTKEFEFNSFDAFKHQVLNSVAPQLELNKWQAIAARR